MQEDSLALIGDIAATVFKFGFAVLTPFFFYRDGDQLLRQTRYLLLGLLGARAEAYLVAIGETRRPSSMGWCTALVQGALAGVGYWFAGVPTPILLGVATAVLSLIPFGAPIGWGAVSLWLFFTGDHLSALGLAAWGALVVSQIDNLLRPLVISSSTRIPYLLVLFAVLGGIASFGLLGLFLGPIVIAVLLAVCASGSSSAPLCLRPRRGPQPKGSPTRLPSFDLYMARIERREHSRFPVCRGALRDPRRG